jgi:DNA-binding MurR/RpiR family transcriptional regulator
MKSLESRILDIYDTLTPGAQRLSEVLLEHQMDLASYTAEELAVRAGVSKATAARLFKSLGYRNYGEAKRQTRLLKNWGSPLLALSDMKQPTELASLADRHKHTEINNIEKSFAMLNESKIERMIDALEKTRRVWIIGLRNGAGIAEYFRYFLTMMKDDVRFLPQSGSSFAEDFASTEAGDVVVAISFRRRPKQLRFLLHQASELGATTVLVTDLSVSDHSRYADFVLRCWCRSPTIFDIHASAVGILGFILSALAVRTGEGLRDRLERIEVLHDNLNDLTRP